MAKSAANHNKAALECAVRYTAAQIRTRAASRIAHFDELLAAEAAVASEHQLVDIEDVGSLAAFLVSDGARRITGTHHPSG